MLGGGSSDRITPASLVMPVRRPASAKQMMHHSPARRQEARLPMKRCAPVSTTLPLEAAYARGEPAFRYTIIKIGLFFMHACIAMAGRLNNQLR